MTNDDRREFYDALLQVGTLYGKERKAVDSVAPLYWEALRRYDLDDVKRAMNHHVQDQTVGQYWPKPADLLRVLEGPVESKALRAWSKVERAIRVVGPYQSVVFDDPVIHAVLEDMGGWISICETVEKELPFRAREFEKRYQGFVAGRSMPSYQRTLIGISQAQAEREGYPYDPPRLIGDTGAAQTVLAGGSDRPTLQISTGLQPLLEAGRE